MKKIMMFDSNASVRLTGSRIKNHQWFEVDGEEIAITWVSVNFSQDILGVWLPEDLFGIAICKISEEDDNGDYLLGGKSIYLSSEINPNIQAWVALLETFSNLVDCYEIEEAIIQNLDEPTKKEYVNFRTVLFESLVKHYPKDDSKILEAFEERLNYLRTLTA